jgi:hypothetical protein
MAGPECQGSSGSAVCYPGEEKDPTRFLMQFRYYQINITRSFQNISCPKILVVLVFRKYGYNSLEI